MAAFGLYPLNAIEISGILGDDVEGAIADVEDTINMIDIIIEMVETAIADMEGAINIVENAFGDLETGLFGFLQILFWIIFFTFLAYAIFMLATMGSNLSKGIHNHVKCGSSEFDYGTDNFAFTVKVMWDCMWQKFILFMNGQCTVYYIVDIIIGIIYMILVELPVVLIRAIFGINLMPFVNDIYEIAILPLNDIILFITGFSIIEWPKSVREKCFLCKGDFKTCDNENVVLYKTFNEWAQLNNCNMAQMKNGFVKIFQSLIPSPKWDAWMNGQELCGYTNNPPF